MRAIGYDAPSAVADLIDNSITARASNVHVLFQPGKASALAIVDNGEGMDLDELALAMRHGSRNPREARAANDLGRFGLGLKTASLSQCRRLTVVTRRNGRTSGMVWDLDNVAEHQDWIAGELEEEDLAAVPYMDCLSGTGTLVVWEKLDVLAAGDIGDGAVLSDRMHHVAAHLALVFHRFIGPKAPLTLAINHHSVVPLDPFLESAGSVAQQEECISVGGHAVVLRAFTLPHISRLSKAQIEKAGGELGLRRQQGFYVYRNRRLIIWGTWFRLRHQEELTKLTRIRVDVPNALDHLWNLDVKKSAASPPPILKDRLRTLLPTLVAPSRRTHQYRGRTSSTGGVSPLWTRVEDRDGVRYEVDLRHPVVASVRAGLEDGTVGEFDSLLKALSVSLPVEALYNDRANDKMGHRRDEAESEELCAGLEEMARMMLSAFSGQPREHAHLLADLDNLEPFALYPKLAKCIKEKLQDGR